jgi:hypothetical protein
MSGRELTDHDMRVIALAENLARAELTPFEQGDEIAYLIDPRDVDGRRVPGAVVLSLQQVADLSGITPGLARRRLSLVLGAAPAVRAACERNEIALHHAEALAAYCDKAQQLDLLPAIIRDRSAWDSRRIREALKPADIPVGCAFFDVALYPVDKIFTDLFGDQWLTDREAFLRLQREAAQMHCAELAAVWAWARIHEGGRLFNSWDYDRDIAPGDGGGAVVHLRDDLQVVVYTALRPRNPAVDRRTAPRALAAPAGDPLVPFHRDSDGLDQRRTGRYSGATSTSILRARPGCRRMRPARSKVSTI